MPWQGCILRRPSCWHAKCTANCSRFIAAWFCARLQAPHAFGAWVLSCTTGELRPCVLTLLTGGALPASQKGRATLGRTLTDAAQSLGVPGVKLRDMWVPLLEDFIHLEIQAENLAVRRGVAKVLKTPSQEVVAGGILLEYVVHYGALQPVPSEAVPSRFGVLGGCVTVELWLSGGRMEVPFKHLQSALDALRVLLNLLRVEVGLKGLPYRPPVKLRRY